MCVCGSPPIKERLIFWSLMQKISEVISCFFIKYSLCPFNAKLLRVFSNPKASELARLAGPISATSANKSGVTPKADCEKAGQELGLPTDCIVSGFCESGLGSTFVKVDLNENCTSVDTVTVMRQGVVPTKDVKAWLMSKTE